MCLALPGEVIKIEGMEIFVKYPDETRKALSGGVNVGVGDYVLVQMGVVIKKLSPEEAEIASNSWV